MHGYKCIVTGATGTNPVAPAQTPVYCAADQTQCVNGAKGILAYNRKSSSFLKYYIGT
jgi:hypothetical protein